MAQNESLRKLYDELYKSKRYTKTYKEFVRQFKTPFKQKKLYTSLNKDKLYTKSFIEFQDQFFGSEITEDINQEQQQQQQQEQPTFETDEMGNKIPVAPSQEVIPQNQTVPELQEGRENSFDTTQEAPTLIERTFGKNTFTDFFGDMYRAGATGHAQGAGVDEFLEVMNSKPRNLSNEDIQDYIDAVNYMNSQPESDEMKEFSRISDENGGGLKGLTMGLLNNFSIAPSLLVQTVVSMLNPAPIAGGVVGAAAGALAGAGVGAAAGSLGTPLGTLIGGFVGAGSGGVAGMIGGMTGALETGISFTEFLGEEMKERGEPMTVDGVRKILNNPGAMNSVWNRALARGMTIAAIEAMSMGVGKAFTSTIGKLGLKGGIGALGKTTKGIKNIQAKKIGSIVGGVAIEGGMGSAGEALGRVAAGQEMDAKDIFLEGIAGTATAPISITSGVLTVPKYIVNGDRVNQAYMDNILETMTPEQLASSELGIEIKNDAARNKIVTDARSRATFALEIDPNVPDGPERERLIDLEVERSKLGNLDLESNILKNKNIKKEIKSIVEKYNGTLDERAVEELKKEGVENPSPKQIKTKADAIFKSESKSLDVQKFTGSSKTMGKGDTLGDTTQESSQENKNAVEETTQEEVVEETTITEEDAISELEKDGVKAPSQDQIDIKLKELISESKAIEEQATEKGAPMKRNETTETSETSNDGVKIKIQEETVLDNVSNYQSAQKIIGDKAIAGYNIVVNTAKRAGKALAKVLPNVKIKIVEDAETYKLLTGKDSRGNYNIDKKTIYINASKASTTTIAHEVAHAVLIETLGINSNLAGLTRKMISSIKKSKALSKMIIKDKDGNSKSLETYLDEFANVKDKDGKSVYSENLKNEEKVAELFGLIAGNFNSLKPKEKGIIREFINKVLKAVGLEKYVSEFTQTDKDIVQFMNVVAGKVSSGTELAQEDVQLLIDLESKLPVETTETKETKGKKKRSQESPKKTVKKETKAGKENKVEKENKRFQADFMDEESGLRFEYLKNTLKFKLLEAKKFITRDRPIQDFHGKTVVLHQPDGAFSGDIFKDGQKLVEGKGGIYYTLKFHDDNYFWAATKDSATEMADKLNNSFDANGGKIYMALTSAPYNKLLSSTTMSNAVLDFFNSVALDRKLKLRKPIVQKAIIEAANLENIGEKKNKKTGKITITKTGLGKQLKLKKTDSFESNLKKIKTALGADNSTFGDRKLFTETLISLMSEEIINNPKAVEQFGTIFSKGIQNKYFKHQGKSLKISKTNMIQALSEMLTEPILKDGFKDRTVGGQVYAMLEVDSKVKAVQTDKHESYPYAIETVDKSQKSIVNLLTNRPQWNQITKDPSTNEIVTPTRESNVFPTFGTSQDVVTLDTTIIDTSENRNQADIQKLGRFYKMEDSGFIDYNKLLPRDLKKFKEDAKALGFTVNLGRVRDKSAYDYNRPTGYYFKKNKKFYNPYESNQRYQFDDDSNISQLIINERLGGRSEVAIIDYLKRIRGATGKEIKAAMETADIFTGVSPVMPKIFLNLGLKKGKALYNKVLKKFKTLESSNKRRTKLSEREITEKEVEESKRLNKEIPTNTEINKEASKRVNANIKKRKTKISVAERKKLREKITQKLQENKIKMKEIADKKLATFSSKLNLKNNKLLPKLTKAEIVDETLEYLQEQPEFTETNVKNIERDESKEFVSDVGEKATQSDLQSLLVAGAVKALGSRPTVDVTKRISNALKNLKERSKGVKNRYLIQQALLSFVRKSLPDIAYKKSRVIKLMRKLKDINAVQKNIDNIIDEVVNEINTINVEILENKIYKLLNDNYVKVENNKSKANKISNIVRKRIDRIKESILLKEAGGVLDKDLKGKERVLAKKKLLAESIGEKNTELQDKINAIINGLELTEEKNNEAADYQIAININNSLNYGQNEARKVELLDAINTNLESLVEEGRSELNDELAAASEKYRKQAEYIYEDITGEKIDLNDPDSIAKAKKVLNEHQISKENEEKLSRFAFTKMATWVNRNIISFLRNGDSLQNLMDGISNLGGEMFEGRTQELVYEKINESSIVFKRFQLEDHQTMVNKYTDLFGGPKKIKGIVIPRKAREILARIKMRKMSKPKDISLSMTSFVVSPLRSAKRLVISPEGRKTSKGNVVYRNPQEVEDAIKKYNEAKGIINKRKAKSELNKIRLQQQLIFSDAETYYLYNQWKDPANRASFLNPDNKYFGPDADRIMSELIDTMSPELKEWADWQTNEFFPSIYERYNDIYKKIYRTDLPWNKYYSGRIYREGIKEEDNKNVDLIGTSNIYQTNVKSSSLLGRQSTDSPIRIMDGNSVLDSYLKDMNYFAAYAENVRDINKIFTNPLIKDAINSTKGKDYTWLIDNVIQKIATRGIVSGVGSTFVNAMNDIFLGTRLALSPVIAVKQLLSAVTYMGDIGVLNWLYYYGKSIGKGLIPGNTFSAIKEIHANSTYLKDRYAQGFQKSLESYSEGSSQLQPMIPGLGKESLMGISLAFSKAGDAGAIYLGGIPNYLFYKEQFLKNNPKATNEQAIKYAIRKFEKDTKGTQQSQDIQDKDYYQTSDPLMRSLNMFKTTPKQYFRKERYSIRQLYRKMSAFTKASFKGENPFKAAAEAGKGSFIDNFRNIMLYHFVMPMTFQYTTIGLPGLLTEWDDEDEYDIIRAAILGNINGLFLLGDIVTAVADYAQDKPYAGEVRGISYQEFLESIMRKTSRYTNAKPDNPKKDQYGLEAAGSILELTQIPATKAIQLGYNVEQLITGKDKAGNFLSTNGYWLRALGYSDYIINIDESKKAELMEDLKNKDSRERVPREKRERAPREKRERAPREKRQERR